MDMPRLFPIGEVAKLFNLSVSSLRHYDNTGLLSPEHTDPETGYRYYGPRQFEALNTIRYLRALDMPLPDIEDFLRNRDVDIIEEKLRRQKQAVIEKKKRLELIERKIDNRLRCLHDAQSSDFDIVTEVKVPSCRIVWMSDNLSPKTFLDMEPSILRLEGSQAEAVVFLGKVGIGISEKHLNERRFGQYDGIFLLLDDEDSFDGEVTRLPECGCVRIRFCGSHTEAPERYEKLMDYIAAQSLRPVGFSREITMIDYGLTADPDKFVTEINIPVE